MLEKNGFERWIRASHAMFETFEGRFDVYPIAERWVQEWLSSGEFTVNKENSEVVARLITDFPYHVFRNFRDKFEADEDKWRSLVRKVDQQFRNAVTENIKPGKCESVGFAIMPFLFTWNFQRFKQYFKKRADFSVEHYFGDLDRFIESRRQELGGYKERKLAFNGIEEENVKGLFAEVNGELKQIGIGNNEPIGTIKLLHLFAPHYFPLIDNDIGEAIGLLHPFAYGYGRESLTADSYLRFMSAMKSWLQNYAESVVTLEDEFHLSILKLVDEGLYMMSTVKQRARVAQLGIRVE